MTNPIAALSRRRLLSGLAVSATAAAAGTLPSAASQQADNPALIRLADQLPALAAEHDTAKADYDKAYAIARSAWPRATSDITFWSERCELEVFIDENGYREQHRVLTPRAIDLWVARELAQADRLIAQGGIRRAKRAESLRANAHCIECHRPAVDAYWAATARIRQDLDFEKVYARYRATQEALRRHVNAIMTTREEAIPGDVIKAQALATWSHTDPFWKAFNDLAPNWSDEIAASIMRQSGEVG